MSMLAQKIGSKIKIKQSNIEATILAICVRGEQKTHKEFSKKAGFVKLNETEGYYECEGIKGLKPRTVFVRWANSKYNLNLRK